MIRVAAGDYIVFRLMGSPERNQYVAYVVEGLNWGYIRKTQQVTRCIGLLGVALMIWVPGDLWIPKVIGPGDLIVLHKSRVFPVDLLPLAP